MKTVVITGGTGDLGAVVVPRLLREYNCAIFYRTKKSWQKLDPAIRNAKNVTALASLDDVKRVAPVYGLVHLAGGFAFGSTPDDFAKMFEKNLMPVVEAVNATLPHIEKAGRIIAISSAASLAKPVGLAAYVASKNALNSYIEVLAKELNDRDINVNALLPTNLDTPANRANTPADHLVKRENVAEMISLLLSSQASSISGQLIGMTA